MKNKKQFTLIELIIVIVVIGILAAMALPKFNGVIRNAKLSAMINDKEVLEKTLIMYYQKNDKLPLLNEDQELIVSNSGMSLSKIVLAEEAKSSDIDTIYKSLKETLSYYKDSEETLYRIDLSKIKDSLSKDIKYGHKKTEKDFYVYSTKTGSVYYYDYLVNGNGTIQHNEYDTLLKENELITKTKSPSLSGEETVINNKPIIELTTNLDNITTNTIINWTYTFDDEDTAPTKISFVLNDVEYNSFDKIPTKLEGGEYTIKLKMQDSKYLWSDEVVKNFIVENKIITNKNSISLGYYHSMKIGTDGNLYTWGDNSYGQLGIGTLTTQLTPQLVKLPNEEHPISVFLGGDYSMTITKDGNLYSWGYNYYGQLGIGSTVTKTTPTPVTFPNEVKPISISLGNSHSMAIGNDENLYSWGDNREGQLGIGTTSNQSTPQIVKLPNGVKPKSISLGNSHSMVIGSDDNVYSWGNNYFGQLGIGNTTNQTTPQKVNIPNAEKPISISLGNSYSIILTDKGNLYSCGLNNYGQLGIGNVANKTTLQKIIIPNEEKPIFISTRNSNSGIISEKGNIYTWGRNVNGELGLGNVETQNIPQLVTLPNGEKPIFMFIGDYHTIVNTNKSNFYTWGRNSTGQLCIGNKINQLYPTKVTLP